MAAQQMVAAELKDERDRPRFTVTGQGTERLESAFRHTLRVEHSMGEPVPFIEARIRGPRFPGSWKVLDCSRLKDNPMNERFDLGLEPSADDMVGLEELGVELRYQWRGETRHELHKWPVSRSTPAGKILWDVHMEVLPPTYWDER